MCPSTAELGLNAEALLFPLVALSLLLAYRYRHRPTVWCAVGLSVVIGLAAMTRSELLLAAPFVLAPLVLTTPDLGWSRRFGRLAVSGLGVLAVTLPWTGATLGWAERPVYLSAGAGGAMLSGSCDATYYGAELGGYRFPDCLYTGGSVSSDPTVNSERWQSAATSYLRRNAGRFPVVWLARQGRSWSVYGLGQQQVQDVSQRNLSGPVFWAQVASFWVLVPVAVLGAVALRRRKVIIYPFVAYAAIVVVATSLTFGDIRYRAAFEVPLVVLAAVGGEAAWTWLRLRVTARPLAAVPA